MLTKSQRRLSRTHSPIAHLQVRRVYEGPTGKVLYDVSFDDGDKEEGVLAGRVRNVGQSPPVLRAGLAVDVKLARKGKVGISDGISIMELATLSMRERK